MRKLSESIPFGTQKSWIIRKKKMGLNVRFCLLVSIVFIVSSWILMNFDKYNSYFKSFWYFFFNKQGCQTAPHTDTSKAIVPASKTSTPPANDKNKETAIAKPDWKQYDKGILEFQYKPWLLYKFHISKSSGYADSDNSVKYDGNESNKKWKPI